MKRNLLARRFVFAVAMGLTITSFAEGLPIKALAQSGDSIRLLCSGENRLLWLFDKDQNTRMTHLGIKKLIIEIVISSHTIKVDDKMFPNATVSENLFEAQGSNKSYDRYRVHIDRATGEFTYITASKPDSRATIFDSIEGSCEKALEKKF